MAVAFFEKDAVQKGEQSLALVLGPFLRFVKRR